MNVKSAYNEWSQTYDSVENKTRDLEAQALRKMIAGENLRILEIGCGTGKNTEYLQTIADRLIGADFSAEMLARANAKITAENVEFRQLDLREKWEFADDSFDLVTCSLALEHIKNFADDSFDLVTCSLALEHIKNIDFVFAEACRVLRENGRFYFGELHPFKQYQGSKARFETSSGVFELECFVHHVSEFFDAARRNDFEIIELKEWFDDEDETTIPRVLTMMWQAQRRNLPEKV